MWSNALLLLQCAAAWLAASVGASYLPLASWDLYLDTLHTVLFKHLGAEWEWSPASDFLGGLLGVPDRAVLHTTFHAIFIAVLVLRLGRQAVLAKWVGCAYLFGAWFVLASGVYLGTVNAEVANEVSLAAADAYTTPWHWLVYALAGQSDWAYPVLVYNFYKGLYILYAYPGIFLPIVRGHLVATADAGAPWARVLVFLVPLYNYVAVWLVVTPRLVRFVTHTQSLWRRLLGTAGGKQQKQAWESRRRHFRLRWCFYSELWGCSREMRENAF